jgi:hypothetical protein
MSVPGKRRSPTGKIESEVKSLSDNFTNTPALDDRAFCRSYRGHRRDTAASLNMPCKRRSALDFRGRFLFARHACWGIRSCYRRSGKYNSARHSYISNNKGAGYGCSTYARNVFSLRLLIFLFNKGNQHIVVKSFFLIPGIPSFPGFFSGRNRCFSGLR